MDYLLFLLINLILYIFLVNWYTYLMKKDIIYIIEGVCRTKGGDTTEFVGAALDKEQAFSVCLDQSKRELFETFKICQYNLKTNKHVGSLETVYPYQEYSADGHLAPESQRVNGKCPQGAWGPYCGPCRQTFFSELDRLKK